MTIILYNIDKNRRIEYDGCISKGVSKLAEYKIKLSRDEVSDFVHAAELCDCDIDIFYNHYIIDANQSSAL